jgi:hypothetical protein
MSLKVRLYVDGFNLYNGLLVPNPHLKWLDLVALGQGLQPGDTIEAVRYFTARVRGVPDPRAPARQKLYLQALTTTPRVTQHFGVFRTHTKRMPVVTPPPRTIEVWKTEEKGSDVNLATYLLLDGLDGLYDEALVISDDSDLVEPIVEANRRFGPVHVFSPRGPLLDKKGRPHPPYAMSHAGASWAQLLPGQLVGCRLPSPLTLPSGLTVHCPPTWT